MVDWKDEVCVGWFLYVVLSGDVLDIPAHEKKRIEGRSVMCKLKRGSKLCPSFPSLDTG